MDIRKIFCMMLAIAMLALLPACAPKHAQPEVPATQVEHHPDFPNVDTSGMTDLQKAVVLTAESYVLRGAKGQYDDTRLVSSGTLAYYRWATGLRQPEDYTSQHTGYSNCAAFAHDLYLAALDLDIGYYTTQSITLGCKNILSATPLLSGYADMNDSQLEAVKQEFLNALQPGDLVVYRYADNKNGHVMCYVGNNSMIHCTGSSYDYEQQQEKIEESGCFRYESIDSFWNPEHRRYLFDKSSYVIVRPLDGFQGEIPQRTLDRMEIMRGVVAEKTSSAMWTHTVNPGQEITFTFTLRNVTGYAKTVTVTDTIPENTVYVSGDGQKDGNALRWTVILPARETVQISYTVRVEAEAGEIVSSSFAEHIPVNCPAIRIGKTLDIRQQEALATAAENADPSYKGIALASAIYREALGTDVLSGIDANEVLEGIFRYFSQKLESGAAYDGNWPAQWRTMDKDGRYVHLAAPNLYGGRNVLEGISEDPYSTAQFMETRRTRMVTAAQLMEGDILITNDSKETFDASAWLYTGGQLLDLQSGEMIPAEPTLSQLLCRKHFVVIRPSLGM